MKIRKAIIPAAGLGTRFLPATKAIPKELLPIVDQPIIQLIVKEAIESGINEVIIVNGPGKEAILNHFDSSPELDKKLQEANKTQLLDSLKELQDKAKITSLYQAQPKGLGHAILLAKDKIANEPFAVLLGDDLLDSGKPCLRQMIDIYNRYEKSVVALKRIDEEDVSRYGICGGQLIEEQVSEIDTMIEKPSEVEAPSNLAIIGRYILNPSIFSYLEILNKNSSKELQLTEAMELMMTKEGFLGFEFTGKHFDVGDRLGYIQACISYALKQRDIAPALRSYMKEFFM